MHTADQLRSWFSYNPDTGVIRAKVKMGNRWPGTPITCRNADGYIQLSVQRVHYLGHRLAWILHYGTEPQGRIDHRNEVKWDNRIDNLRDGAEKYNPQNVTKANKNSTSGIRGVRFRKEKGKWQARIMVNFKEKHLGYFLTQEEAEAAYLEGKKLYHPDCGGNFQGGK